MYGLRNMQEKEIKEDKLCLQFTVSKDIFSFKFNKDQAKLIMSEKKKNITDLREMTPMSVRN